MSDTKRKWKEMPPQQLQRALAGHRRDLDALVRWYGPIVWAAVAARVRGLPRVYVPMEDLVGDVWVELCRNDRKRLRYYDPARGEFGYFIRMQAAQIAWKRLESQLRRPELVPESGPEPADEWDEQRMVDRDLLTRLLRTAKSTLGSSDWALFLATYVEGLSAEQAAERLGKKVKTIYQQKYRLRTKLEDMTRQMLTDEDGHPPSEGSVGMVVAFLLASLTPLHQGTTWATNSTHGVDILDGEPLEDE